MEPLEIVREKAFDEGVERGAYMERQRGLTLLTRLAQASDVDAMIIQEHARLMALQSEASPIAQGLVEPTDVQMAQAHHLAAKMKSSGARDDLGDQVATLVEQMMGTARKVG